jgi:hypothetical protein
MYKYEKNGKKFIKFIKIDIAYVPDIVTSKLCKNIFKEKSDMMVDCIFDKSKSNWKPICVNKDKEFPSIMNEYL